VTRCSDRHESGGSGPLIHSSYTTSRDMTS
jgi:hypothetical protein